MDVVDDLKTVLVENPQSYIEHEVSTMPSMAEYFQTMCCRKTPKRLDRHGFLVPRVDFPKKVRRLDDFQKKNTGVKSNTFKIIQSSPLQKVSKYKLRSWILFEQSFQTH